MKLPDFPLIIGLSCTLSLCALGATSSDLPYGVGDIVKLSKAGVSENVIKTYVESSGTVYNLTPDVIVRLREQGVSDPVITAMLDQKKKLADFLQTAAAAPAYAPAPAQTTAPAEQPVQVQPTAPASTVYVIPNRSAYYYDNYPYYPYSYYPYSWPYYSSYYYRPSIGIGFGYRPYCGPALGIGFGFRFGAHGGFHHHHW